MKRVVGVNCELVIVGTGMADGVQQLVQCIRSAQRSVEDTIKIER